MSEITDITDMSKVIITDVDGVLLDWHGLFRKWMTSKGFVEDFSQTGYSLALKYGLPDAEMSALVRQFNCSAAVGFCAPERDAAHYVRRLGERGFTFVVITAMGGDRYSEMLRVQNLERVFGKVFTQHHFVELNAPKDDVLELFAGTECWWIEDKLSNAEAGLKYGLRPILLRHDHNSHCDSDDILIADNWKQIFTFITGEQAIQ